jgi:hypothetical protein
MKVMTPSGMGTRAIMGELTDRYDLHAAYENARARKDPLLAPHGFFRALKPRSDHHIREFLEQFGPLTLDVGKRLLGTGAGVGLDVDQFWGLHHRFCIVSELWDSLRDRNRLAKGLLELSRQRREISNWEKFPIGTQFSPPPANKRSRYKFPWQVQRQRAETWLKRASLDEMRKCSLSLVHLELNVHMRDRRIVWQRGWEPSGEKFRPIICVDSLWSAIWEFWGMDMAGIAWRSCPHCQTLFYPKRRDQFYCTPRQQALASKRNYAARRRNRQKAGSTLKNPIMR